MGVGAEFGHRLRRFEKRGGPVFGLSRFDAALRPKRLTLGRFQRSVRAGVDKGFRIVMVADESVAVSPLSGAGMRLAKAREEAGLSLAEVSVKTRIQERHLRALEVGDFAVLPGRTYAIGFARSYARVVGLNEGEVATAMGRDFARHAPTLEVDTTPAFAPGDPARVPSSGFAWAAGIAVLVAGVGGFIWWQHALSPTVSLPSLLPPATQAAAPAPAPVASVAPSEAPSAAASEAAQPSGPVVFTAEADGLWVRFYDGSGKRLLEKLMSKGESYTVPADAVDPQVRTGRPEALSITIGGKAVPKLADVQKTVKDVPVSAAALLARGQQAPAASASPVAAPTSAPLRKVYRPRPKPVASDGGAAPAAPSTAPGAPSTAG